MGITENDLRLPEFRGVAIEDLEIREDGKIVRKDRWEQGIRAFANKLGQVRNSFEVEDIVNMVLDLDLDLDLESAVARFLQWNLPADFNPDCGITFARFHPNGETKYEPVGTNLLNAEQAKSMLAHVLRVSNDKP